MGKIVRNGIEFSSTSDTADNINYNNSKSGLEAMTVQEAVDEVNENINTLNSDVSTLNNSLVASDNLKFQFATDGEGNYGYLGADDSFIPFKKGSSEIVYKDFSSSVSMNKTTSGSWGGVSGSQNINVAYAGYTPIYCGLITTNIPYNGAGGVYGVVIKPTLSSNTLNVYYGMQVAVNGTVTQKATSTVRVFYKEV